ncbi:MAG: hypothetical protein HN368_07070 [Spirochaetales bacterium]|nr:hypothetical protein [Spirochaetales bacterium]
MRPSLPGFAFLISAFTCAFIFAGGLLTAQEIGGEEAVESDSGDSFFSDPFSIDESSDTDELDLSLDMFSLEPVSENDEFSFDLDDVDSMFQDEMLEEAEIPEEGFSPESGLLVTEGITWGGRISGSINSEWSWNNLWTNSFDIIAPGSQTLSPSVSSSLFFDARPNDDFRGFGKLMIFTESGDGLDFAGTINNAALTGDLPEGWTREEDDNGDTVIRDADGVVVFTVSEEDPEEEEEPQTGTAPALSIDVLELFFDFNYDERVFFRFGKHTIKWGVGYFWSPADVLNLSVIDAEDPTADREGPVSLKAHLPFDLNNLYLYVITNSDIKPLETALAPKLEMVYGNTEYSIAGYYQRALSPRGIFTFTSSIRDLDLFGEGVVTYGSDRIFVRESRKSIENFPDPPEDLNIVLDTFEIGSALLFSGTIGLRYLKDIDQRNMARNPGSIAVIGQYFYNGEGYTSSRLLKPAIFLQQNPEYNGLAKDAAEQPESYIAPPNLTFGDITPWGQHYGALTLNWSNIFNSDVSVSLLGLGNLSDLSFIISPTLSFKLLDTFNVSLGMRMTYGDDGDEFTNQAALIGQAGDTSGATLSFSLGVSLGGGSF